MAQLKKENDRFLLHINLITLRHKIAQTLAKTMILVTLLNVWKKLRKIFKANRSYFLFFLWPSRLRRRRRRRRRRHKLSQSLIDDAEAQASKSQQNYSLIPFRQMAVTFSQQLKYLQ